MALLAACGSTGEAAEETATGNDNEEALYTSESDLIVRGEYLVSILDCDNCHTPKVMTDHGPEWDMSRRLSGYPSGNPVPSVPEEMNGSGWIGLSMDIMAAAGPWGMSFSANLTPHETGLGNWTVEQFKTAIRKGKYKGQEGGRDLLPPMPWYAYANMTDEDLEAVFAYLQTLPPVDNVVPDAIPPAMP